MGSCLEAELVVYRIDLYIKGMFLISILLSEKTKLLVLMSQSLPLSAQKSPMSRSGAAPVGSSTSLWPQAIWLWWSDQTRLPQEALQYDFVL
ncbi:hypothetical protein Bca52824_067953 [Brassica carinata]|uniref:Uncharacterized protein n=1 Tax=Brassica carinata TaxID=52824 RepID=A0A8X7QNC9_BRACI|nr:hypothetical protein Bca52824_067953 [Brassica carinata]